jgi:hypothetical protein
LALIALLFLALSAVAFTPSTAFASYITYEFLPPQGSSCVGRVCTVPWLPPGDVFDFFPATLTVTDAAVASGRFDLNLSGICLGTGPICTGGFGGGGSYQGDIVDFDSLIIGPRVFSATEIATPTTWIGLQGIHVAFNPDGTLTGGVVGGGFTSDLTIMGSEFNWLGSWGSDALGCFDQNFGGGSFGCFNAGYWYTSQALPTEVPEPDNFWVFLGGLAALIMALSRVAKVQNRKLV